MGYKYTICWMCGNTILEHRTANNILHALWILTLETSTTNWTWKRLEIRP